MNGVYGREAERSAIARLIHGAAAARGGALVIVGEPGVGKTALLADAVAGLDGFTVLRTQGVESESPLAFAALYRLLRPVLDRADRLPGPQARALRVAFGQEEGPLGDRFLVFMATLSLLADAAEQAPVVCVVDDAPWLDAASAEALLFVARRLQVDRIALLFGARNTDVRRFDADLNELVLTGIDREAACRLLSERAGVPISDEVCDRLMARTGGNPLALVELPGTLSPAQLIGQARLPDELPLTQRVEHAFLDRCRRLPPDAQTVLLVAAADDAGRATTVWQAAARLGAGPDDIQAAEQSGLVKARDGRLQMRHPLVRSAVYGAATSIERQRAHRALADVLTAGDDTDRRVWHLSQATAKPDEAVASALAQVADGARRRGGHEAASAAFARAAELSTSSGRRGGRLHAAAMSAWMAGQLDRARLLAEEARLHTDDLAARADIDALRGRIVWNVGSRDCGQIVLRAALDLTAADPVRALETAMLATSLVAITGDLVDPAPVLRAVPPPKTVREECLQALLAGHSQVAAGHVGGAASAFHRALALCAGLPGELDLLVNQAVAAMWLGADDDARQRLIRIDALTRNTGAVTFRRYVASRLPFTDVPAGRWDAVRATAAEALELVPSAEEAPLQALPWSWLALVAALRGDQELDRFLAEAERVRAPRPTGIFAVAEDVTRWARGIAAANANDPSRALHHLRQIDLPVLQRLAALDRIETAVRAGDADTARTWVEEIDTFGRRTGVVWAAATAAHGRALLDDASAEAEFTAALAGGQEALRPVMAARTQLAFGEYLRRSRRRVDAREHLRAALETFEDVGALPWAERARQELRASGETARRGRRASSTESLTPQELQIAQLAASGRSNRDIAAQCFLSVRTVEFHLSNAYMKLGIRSRTELAQLSLA